MKQGNEVKPTQTKKGKEGKVVPTLTKKATNRGDPMVGLGTDRCDIYPSVQGRF